MNKHSVYSSFLALLVVTALLMGVAASASAQTVSEVQAAIKAQGAFWVAGDNPVSRLTVAQQKQLLGVVNPPRSAAADSAPTCQTSPVGLPASLDWRNNGGNYVTSVKNQGSCGSCWAFSAIATLESATMVYNKTPNTSLDLSEQVLISCCDSTCSPSGQCGGGWPSKAADFLRDNGAPADSCYTYVGSGSCGSACANWKASAYKIKSWEWIVNYDTAENPTVDKIRAGLQNGPLAIAFAVYNDFFSYTSGVYKHVSGGLAGYHAVLVVGYDDAGQYFIVKNSWATTWGEQGYFKIAYSEVTGDSRFGYMTLAYHVGDAPNPTCEYPMSEYFTAAGGSANVQVATNSGCNWTASSNASWITITSGSSGSGPGVLAYTIAPNTASSRRTGTMTVPGGTYTVLQESGSGQCTYLLSPTSNSFTAAAGTGSFNVTAGSGCSWTATSSNASWLSVTSGSSGTGNGAVNYSAMANTTSASRSATINVANQTFTVTQAAGSNTCTYSISPTSNFMSSTGGTGTVNVTAGSGCTWAAVSNSPWISVTSGASGTGNGTVTYNAVANTDGPQRSGTMTIAGQTFTVTETPGCSWSINPSSQSFSSAAGNGSVTVYAGSGCSWSVTSNTSWITVTSGSSGTGPGTVNYTVQANTGTARTGIINFKLGSDFSFNVSQAAGSNTCTYAISPTSVGPVPSVGYNGTVAVTAGSGCAWTAKSNTSWLTVTGGSSGTASGTVSYSVAPNTDGTQRTGTVTIAGQTFTVSQSIGCSWSINPSSRSLGSGAGNNSVTVYAGSSCSWSATSNASWLIVTSGASGTGNGTVTYGVTANTGAARTGTITGIGGLTHTVTQAAGSSCTYAISPTSASFGTAAGTGSVSVTAGPGCAWTAVSNNTSWLTVTGGSNGSGNGTVGYLAAANASTTSRTGTLTIGGQTFTVTQAGTSCAYSLTPMSHDFGAPGGTFTVNITTSAECPWALAAQYPWITLTSATSGKGNATATYSVAANSGASRSGVIFLNALPFVGNHLVTQAAGSSCTYAISPTSVGPVPSVGYNGTVAVTAGSGCAWTAKSNTSWLTVTGGSSGTASGTVSYSVAPNTDGTQRTGTVTIAGQTFTVSQSIGCSWSINPSSRSLGSGAGNNSVTVYAGSSCSWSATSNASWLIVTSGASGTGNGTVTYGVTANTGAARTGTITGIGGLTHTVTQAAGSSCTYAISPTSASFGTAAGTGSVSVTAGPGCAWTAVSNNTSWLTVTGGSNGSGNGTVGYLAAANASTTSRTGTLTIGGQTFTVTQAGTSCAYSLTPMSHDFGAPGGTFTVNITTSAECPWALAAQYPWITLTSATSGKGNATATYSVAANSGASRSGVIFLNALPFVGNHLVTQAAGSSCTYAISPTSVGPVPSVGYNGTVAVTAGSGCAWTAKSNTSWLTVTGGSSGTASGTVSYSVAPNTDGTQRTGTVTIAGQTFTVSQSIGCSWSINPSSQSFTSAAGSGSIAVTAGSACAWTATSNVSWLTITSGGSGPGNGTVKYSVAANTGAARTGTITGIGGLTHTVTQAGTSTCSVSTSTGSVNLSSSSSQGHIPVNASSTCAWSASTNVPWITFISGTGTGNGTITFVVSANTGAARMGTITIGPYTVTVNQAVTGK